MGVSHDARLARRDHAQPALAQRERRRDVEVAVEAVALIETADGEERFAPRREAVALDRVAGAAGHLVPLLQVIDRTQTPRPRGADAARAKRLGEDAEEVVGQLDRWIELQQQLTACQA